jgi:hypothetical protein
MIAKTAFVGFFKTILEKIFGAGVILVYTIIAASAMAARAQPVRFSLPANAAGTAGETAMIPLNLDPNNNAVGSFDATVEFKNTLLTYAGFTIGPILAANDNWVVDINDNNASGTIVVGAFSFARVTGAGPAVLLKFVVSATAAGGDTAHLSLRRLAATDTNAVPLRVEGREGKFTVKPVLSGRVLTAAGVGISGVIINGLPDNSQTDAQGYYRAILDPGWVGTAMPTKSGYTFDPPSRQYNRDSVTHDQTAQDYLGTEILEASFAFPHPFNPETETTRIRFVLKNPASASIKILDGRGDMVRELISPLTGISSAVQFIEWEGRNGRGDWVDNGIYFYIIEAPANHRMTGKIGVVR